MNETLVRYSARPLNVWNVDFMKKQSKCPKNLGFEENWGALLIAIREKLTAGQALREMGVILHENYKKRNSCCNYLIKKSDKPVVQAMLDKGLTIGDIAKHYKCSTGTVRKFIRIYKINYKKRKRGKRPNSTRRI